MSKTALRKRLARLENLRDRVFFRINRTARTEPAWDILEERLSRINYLIRATIKAIGE